MSPTFLFALLTLLICENKGADQVCSWSAPLCFATVITIPLLISSRQRSSEAAQPSVCISRGATHIIKPLHEIGYCTLHISDQRWLGRADFGRKLVLYIHSVEVHASDRLSEVSSL